MPRGRVSKPLKDAGGIEEVGPCFRAHVQYSEAGKKNDIRGPHRNDRPQAQKDLDDMRACGALFSEDRANGLEAMKVEARRMRLINDWRHRPHKKSNYSTQILGYISYRKITDACA